MHLENYLNLQQNTQEVVQYIILCRNQIDTMNSFTQTWQNCNCEEQRGRNTPLTNSHLTGLLCNPKNLFNIAQYYIMKASSYYKAPSKNKPIPYGCQSHSLEYFGGSTCMYAYAMFLMKFQKVQMAFCRCFAFKIKQFIL